MVESQAEQLCNARHYKTISTRKPPVVLDDRSPNVCWRNLRRSFGVWPRAVDPAGALTIDTLVTRGNQFKGPFGLALH